MKRRKILFILVALIGALVVGNFLISCDSNADEVDTAVAVSINSPYNGSIFMGSDTFMISAGENNFTLSPGVWTYVIHDESAKLYEGTFEVTLSTSKIVLKLDEIGFNDHYQTNGKFEQRYDFARFRCDHLNANASSTHI